jgi:hypothetical protein
MVNKFRVYSIFGHSLRLHSYPSDCDSGTLDKASSSCLLEARALVVLFAGTELIRKVRSLNMRASPNVRPELICTSAGNGYKCCFVT